MYKSIEIRVIDEALYAIETGATVRQIAKQFEIGKSTVHKDLTVRLKDLDSNLYLLVKDVLRLNLSERHIRGGMATKNKYKNLK